MFPRTAGKTNARNPGGLGSGLASADPGLVLSLPPLRRLPVQVVDEPLGLGKRAVPQVRKVCARRWVRPWVQGTRVFGAQFLRAEVTHCFSSSGPKQH